MVLTRKSVVDRAVSDGLLNRRILKICGRVKSFTGETTVTPVGGFVDFLKGMEVLNDEYVRNGITRQTRVPFIYNEGLIDRDSTLFLAREGREIVGTVSLLSNTHHPMPSEKLFAKEIEALELKNRRVVEVGTLSVKKTSAAKNVVFRLYLTIMMHAIFVKQVDDIFIQVKEKTSAFYVNNLLFEKVTESKTHPDYRDLPASLLRVDLKNLREKIYNQQCYGAKGWLRLVIELGLLAEFKSVRHGETQRARFHLGEQDAEVYRYLCHL